ncbi:hypothetical protein Tsp_06309 [Trichinella spiralis]|uniref:hypothetical protein n=1 Tax=Trichinella spiralis TaxID=6334 RepID=UPI0001EFBCEE|nr:hypothetical protein Tsp_06309 [Trichinella spiralis]
MQADTATSAIFLPVQVILPNNYLQTISTVAPNWFTVHTPTTLLNDSLLRMTWRNVETACMKFADPAMRSGGGFWQGVFDENETNVRIYAKPPSGQGCEQSLEKAVWQGRDPDVVEVNLNSPLFLSVTRVRRSGRGLAF